MSAPADLSAVRRATLDDAVRLSELLNAVVAEGRYSLLGRTFTAAEERAFIAALPPRGFIHMAEETAAGPGRGGDARLAGAQTLEPYAPNAPALGHVATIGTWVAAAQRRRGVGRRLCEATFAVGRDLGYSLIVTDIRADNPGSLAFHLAMGFAVAGSVPSMAQLGGCFVDVDLVWRRI